MHNPLSSFPLQAGQYGDKLKGDFVRPMLNMADLKIKGILLSEYMTGESTH